MKRIPEPELMDDAAQACAYAAADFNEPHQAFINFFRQVFAKHDPKRVLDLGCGTADVSIRYARNYPGSHITGIDGAKAMLALGQRALRQAQMEQRIRLRLCRLPQDNIGDSNFDTIISNSLLHHLQNPLVLWDAVRRYAAQDAAIMVMDLMRPDTEEQASMLVRQYAAGEAEILRHDFYHSLLAAYLPSEVQQQLRQAQLDGLQLEVISDRHWVVWGILA